MRWYLKVLGQYADFGGRARRREYWMFTLVNGIISIVLTILDAGLGLELGGGSAYGGGVLSSIYGLAVLLPGLAVAARRLHDTDRSGWWQLLPVAPVVPLFALIPFTTSAPPSTVVVVALFVLILATIVASLVVLVWMATDGRAGPNRFGPNPKEPVPSPVPEGPTPA